MAKTPEPDANVAGTSIEEILETTAGRPIAEIEAVNEEGTEAVMDSPSDKLAELFDHLKIFKVVFVDDKAEQPVDAGSVFKVLVEKDTAKEPLAAYFPSIELTIENEALLDQLAMRLGELDAGDLLGLRDVLSKHSDDAAEREALVRLKDLLPKNTEIQLLTPHAWLDQRDALIEECTEERRNLFFFDQELEGDQATLGFSKGSDIIRDMAEKEKAGFGTRWFCGMLTHTVQLGSEVEAWLALEKSENLDLQYFMPIAKATLDDTSAFYGAVYRTLITTYSQTMKGLAQGAFEEALKDALEKFASLDPIDFEHMVVKSSEIEGVSELDTLIRLYGIIQKDQVKSQILQEARVGEFTSAARSAKEIADIGRELSSTSKERLQQLRREELYESDQLVNSYNDPLRNGDLFEIGEGEAVKLWVLIAQPCDLMVRSNGKRVREENFKVAVLAPVRTRPRGKAEVVKGGLHFSLEHYDHAGAQSAIVQFADATPANLQVLDLAVFKKDGRCQLSSAADPNLNLPSSAWEKRDAELRKHFGRVAVCCRSFDSIYCSKGDELWD